MPSTVVAFSYQNHPPMHAIRNSRDNEWCVGKQKSNKSTRDQNGAGGEGGGERETKNVPFKKPQSLTLSARASFCDIASFAMDFFSRRAHYIPAGRSSVWAFFLSVRRPNPRRISVGPHRVCLEQTRPRNGLESNGGKLGPLKDGEK